MNKANAQRRLLTQSNVRVKRLVGEEIIIVNKDTAAM